MRKSDNTLYKPDTLTSFQRSLDHHLTQELHKPYSILRDAKFAFLREKIKNTDNKKEKGKKKAAVALEISDIDSMWALGTLGDSCPEVLLNTAWFLLTLHMGLRGRDEHYKLTYGDLAIQTIPDGPKYVEFNERDTKICSGETNPSRQFKPKMWSTPNNLSRCPLQSATQKCTLLNHLFIWL